MGLVQGNVSPQGRNCRRRPTKPTPQCRNLVLGDTPSSIFLLFFFFSRKAICLQTGWVCQDGARSQKRGGELAEHKRLTSERKERP